jgi:hypothetical protein
VCNVVAADIVFDYRQKATRTFQYLQGDYYIAPAFLVSLLLIMYKCAIFLSDLYYAIGEILKLQIHLIAG